MPTTGRVLLAVALALAVTLALGAHPAEARTWHIQPNGSGDAPTIQAGIDSAAAGDTVLVHDGTYTGAGNKNLDFHGKNLTLRSANGAASAVVDCENAGRGIFLHTGEGTTARIEGLTIRNGRVPDGETDPGGGGMRLVEVYPTVRGCVFERCWGDTVAGRGGAVFALRSSGRIEGCSILDSRARYGGGFGDRDGDVEIRECVIRGNKASSGGGLSVDGGLWLKKCLIAGNRAVANGGGIFLLSECDGGVGALDSCTVTGNWAGEWGGGVAWAPCGSEGNWWSTYTVHWGNWAPDGVEMAVFSDAVPTGFGCTNIDQTKVAGGVRSFYDTITETPLFSDPVDASEAPTTAGDYALDAASPCLAQSCGDMGWPGLGCDIYTDVAASSDGGAGAFADLTSLRISPNPSGGAFTIQFGPSARASSTLHVFDIAGRLVRAIDAPAAQGSVVWDGKDLVGRDAAPGVYFVRSTDGVRTDTRRVILVR